MEQLKSHDILESLEADFAGHCEDILSSWGDHARAFRYQPEWAESLPNYYDYREDWLKDFAQARFETEFTGEEEWLSDDLYCDRLLKAYAEHLNEGLGVYRDLPTLARYKEYFDSTYRTRYAYTKWAA